MFYFALLLVSMCSVHPLASDRQIMNSVCVTRSLFVSLVGQLLTYHFASMLGLDNVPMTLLRHSDRRSRQRVAARLDDRGPYLMERQLSPTSSVNIVTQYIPIPQAEWYATSLCLLTQTNSCECARMHVLQRKGYCAKCEYISW